MTLQLIICAALALGVSFSGNSKVLTSDPMTGPPLIGAPDSGQHFGTGRSQASIAHVSQIRNSCPDGGSAGSGSGAAEFRARPLISAKRRD